MYLGGPQKTECRGVLAEKPEALIIREKIFLRIPPNRGCFCRGSVIYVFVLRADPVVQGLQKVNIGGNMSGLQEWTMWLHLILLEEQVLWFGPPAET